MYSGNLKAMHGFYRNNDVLAQRDPADDVDCQLIAKL